MNLLILSFLALIQVVLGQRHLYKHGLRVSCDANDIMYGTTLMPTDCSKQPQVHLPESVPQDKAPFTVLLIDPDYVPSPRNVFQNSYLHWAIINIIPSADGDLTKHGDLVVPYRPPTPPSGTGLHRYIFVLYRQTKKIDITPDVKRKLEKRVNFGLDHFANAYGLEYLGGNFFLAENE